MLVSPKNGAINASLLALAALSRERTEVVPTATTRLPRALQANTASTTSCGTSAYSACMTCSSMVSTRTGWKVPAPTCSVTKAISMPFSRSSASSGSSKCSPAVGAATAPGFSL
ncbi:hypothetical protein D3C78_1525730 [compost metagenome]